MLLSVSLLLATSYYNHLPFLQSVLIPSPFFQFEILEILITSSLLNQKQSIRGILIQEFFKISNRNRRWLRFIAPQYEYIVFLMFQYFQRCLFFQNCRFLTSYYFIYSRAQSRNKTVETQVIHTPLSTTTPMSIPRSDNPGKNTARQWQYPNPRGVPDRGPLAGPTEGDLPMGLPVGPPEEFQYLKMVH